MPGSNIIKSTDPQLYENDVAVESSPSVVPAQVKPAAVKTSPYNLPELYQRQDYARPTFDKEAQFKAQYGSKASKWDRKRFDKYWNSDQRKIDEQAFNAEQDQLWLAHDKQENEKFWKSWNARQDALRSQVDAQTKAFVDKVNASTEQMKAASAAGAPIPQNNGKTALVPRTDWNARAKEYGFNSMDEVKQWQAANGLAVDGKFGKKSLEVWNAQQNPTPASTSGTPIAEPRGTSSDLSNTPIPEPSVTPAETKRFNLRQFAQHNGLDIVNKNGQEVVRWDPSGFGDFWVDSNGEIYEGGRTFDNTRKFRNTAGLGYGERKNRYEALQAAISGQSETGDYGVKIIEKRPTSTTVYPRPAYTHAPYRALYRKQGGTMNRINYFQQGGAAPKQDIKAQVTALVQAAMQGDQKATQQVNQIMEAAKAGNQQAVQLAQLITEVAKQLQGQATSAKWGSKLGYIKSLKFAKGGKTCPVCEKKVEMKACGGKKAKKRYFGGII